MQYKFIFSVLHCDTGGATVDSETEIGVFMKTLSLSRVVGSGKLHGENCLLIEAPYDADLVASIKAIDSKQREYEDRKWWVLENDPNQQEEELTNLEYVRSICQEACDRNNWTFLDHTSKSSEEIAQELNAVETEELEAHVEAVCNVLPRISRHALRLVAWGEKALRIQLQSYIGEDVWHELRKACTEIWKPKALIMSSENRMNFGFVFEMSPDPRILRALMSRNDVENLKAYDLKLKEVFDEGKCVHLLDADENLWIGSPVDQSEMDSINWGSQPWEVADVEGQIYWVANAEAFIDSWLGDLGYTLCFNVFLPKSSKVSDLIEREHLQTWFEQWSKPKFFSDELKLLRGSRGDSPFCWEHPADSLISHINRFYDRGGAQVLGFTGLSRGTYDQRVDEIKSRKQAMADQKLEELRAAAIELVVAKLCRENDQKALLRMAGEGARASWPKEKIARHFVTQEYAESVLGIANKKVSSSMN